MMWDVLAALALLAVTAMLGGTVATVILVFSHLSLRRRVRALELALSEAPVAAAAARAAEASPAPAAAAPGEAPAVPEPPPAAAAAPPPLPWDRPAAATAADASPESAAEAPAEAAGAPDRPIVVRAESAHRLVAWLRENWVYAISALSLALAGLYFVQYGIERGLLSPAARVAAAVVFGLALIAAGEWLRRRETEITAILPGVFAGAGLVSVFGGVVAARMLYGLIGPELSLVLLVAVSLGGVLLGWLHGPFLAAFGLIGAAAAPFAVGGNAETPYWLYFYFVLVAALGLAIDAARRWAWVSVLALVLGYGCCWFVLGAIGGAGWFALALTLLALLAVLVPRFELSPEHPLPTTLQALTARGTGPWPEFPVRLAGGAMLASALGLTAVQGALPADSLLAFFCLAVLAVTVLLWTDRAPGLSDLALLPAVGFLLRLFVEADSYGPLQQYYLSQAAEFREPGTAAPWTATVLLALAAAISLTAAWRSGRAPFAAAHAAGAAAVAPVAAVLLELFWAPSFVAGAYPWALQVIALAAGAAFLAERFARADGEDRRRTAYAVLACLTLVALALFVVVTKAALTVALGVLAAAAAALDRRFRLPEMGYAVIAGVLVLGWRFIIDPGILWALEAPLWEVVLGFAGGLLGLAAAMRLLPPDRPAPRLFLEGGLAGGAAVFANALLARWLNAADTADTFWSVAVHGFPWLVVALVQLHRAQLGGFGRRVRYGLAAVAGLLALSAYGTAALPLNPLWQPPTPLGPPLLDRLFLSYGLPAVALALALTRLGGLHRWLRGVLGAVAIALGALWLGLEIRRAWRGDALALPGVAQGELYSYTLALMLLGAGLLAAAILRRSAALRWAATAVIALTIAKVFLIDAAGLTGLTRVVSFLGLGLALAGLAALNRWAARASG